MEFLQLQYFLDAAEGENFSATAKKYKVPPSNISQTIKRLEEELSVKLFKRSSNKITLSEEGKAFYEGVKKGLFEINEARRKILSPTEEWGEVKLLIETNRRLVTEAIERFRVLYPEAPIIISHISEPDVSYDIIVSDSSPAGGEYVSRHIMTEKILLASLSGRFVGEASLADLRDERFISMGKGSRLFTHTMEMCKECGFVPKTVIQTDDPYYVRKYVEMGLGVALVPSVSWKGLFSDNVTLTSVGSFFRNTYLYTPASSAKNLSALRLSEIILEVFEKECAQDT